MPALILSIPFLAASLGSAGVAAAGQGFEIPEVRYPQLKAAAPDADGFVPPGWEVVGRDSGDLNGDGRADLVLLMQMRDPANVLTIPGGDGSERFDTNPHLLAVVFAAPAGGYRLAASNSGLFFRPAAPYSGDDPLGDDTISIERGSLLVSFGFLRGGASYRFRWRSGAFRLIGYDASGVSGGCVESISINYPTRRAQLTNEPVESDRTRVARRRVIGRAPPTLDRIDLDSFRPEEDISGPPLPCPRPGDE
ncbi:MAG TPA: hypothetical protein VF702_14240 [Allosphingosinicella sp.]|jgi:hypothetical protein